MPSLVQLDLTLSAFSVTDNALALLTIRNLKHDQIDHLVPKKFSGTHD